MTCPGCGFEAPSDFAFCPKCGRKLSAPLAAAEGEGDRRRVTVVFADVSGFTSLSERLDPEDVRTFQAELFSDLQAAVEEYGGFVEKFVGDAVMAVFGAPVAHEDDPERALRAALRMHQRVERLSAHWERRIGRTVALHVGVNTGPVVAGQLGAGASAAYAVTGDTVNTTARLQGAARPGETVVSRSTWDLCRHAFAFAPLGGLALKGKAEPVEVFGLLSALDAPRSARGLEAHGLTGPLIGRAGELAQRPAPSTARSADAPRS